MFHTGCSQVFQPEVQQGAPQHWQQCKRADAAGKACALTVIGADNECVHDYMPLPSTMAGMVLSRIQRSRRKEWLSM